MARPTDGRYRLAREAVVAYAGSRGERSLAHARLYEAGEQQPVVIVGELTDNPGTAAMDAIDSVMTSVKAAWLPEATGFRLLVYDVTGQTFSEVVSENDSAASTYVSILDVLGVMPALFNADEYTLAARGGVQAPTANPRGRPGPAATPV